MLYQILSLGTRKDMLGEAIDAETLAIRLPELIDQVGAIIVMPHEDDFDDWVKTKSGMILYYDVQNDCDENYGGYFVEVYTDINFIHRLDYFCVHPEDCDCKNEDAVYDYVRQYIRENY